MILQCPEQGTPAKNVQLIAQITQLPFELFLLEHIANTEDGTSALQSLQSLASELQVPITPATFSDKDSMVEGLKRAAGRATVARLLLVISAHGEEATGTWISSKNGPISLDMVMGDVPEIPGLSTVFLSVCWGGYPGMPRALRSRNKIPPLVLGPQVEILPVHANAFQAELARALLQPESEEEDIVSLVNAWNTKYREEYDDKSILSILRRDGSRVPDWGTAGLAGKRSKYKNLKLLALQRRVDQLDVMKGRIRVRNRRVTQDDDAPTVAVMYDFSKRELWHVDSSKLESLDAPIQRGNVYSFTATRSQMNVLPSPFQGQLVDLDNVRFDRRSRHFHRFAHANVDTTSVETETPILRLRKQITRSNPPSQSLAERVRRRPTDRRYSSTPSAQRHARG